MHQTEPDFSDILTASAPACANRRLLLFAIRRIAAGGLNDAHATHALLTAFGRSFRRPLVLLRALMAEVSRVSNEKILVAPCCCPRLTAAEAMLVEAIAQASDHPRDAHGRLCTILGVNECLGALGSGQAVAMAFADCGKPLAPA